MTLTSYIALSLKQEFTAYEKNSQRFKGKFFPNTVPGGKSIAQWVLPLMAGGYHETFCGIV